MVKIYGGLLAFIFAVAAFYQHGTVDHVDITVKRLERVHSESGGYYLVFTKGGEVFGNKDALFHLKFDSSDIQGRLSEGESYRAKVYGWRVPFFSMYRNIVSIRN